MKLIDEKLVEEISRSDRWFESIGTPSSDYQLGFINGSNWTQSQLKQKMIEFAEWMKEQPILICQTTNGHQWSSSYVGGGYYTSEQLLEEFINQNK